MLLLLLLLFILSPDHDLRHEGAHRHAQRDAKRKFLITEHMMWTYIHIVCIPNVSEVQYNILYSGTLLIGIEYNRM